MGEAKRRKQAGLGFDPSLKLITGCYIAPAIISDSHAVYLGIRRKNAHTVNSKPLSVHTSVIDAWKVFTDCEKILLDSSFSFKQSDDEIFRLFLETLHNTYGNHSEGADRYQVAGNLDAFNAWMEEGIYRDKSKPPHGVIITPLTLVVKKRYKVFCTPLKKESKNFYGNPEDNSINNLELSYR